MQRRTRRRRYDQAVGLQGGARVGCDGDQGADPFERALGRTQIPRPVVEHDDRVMTG